MGETEQSALEVIEENAPATATYSGALVAVMPFIPIAATIMSIATFVVLLSQTPSFLISPPWLGTVIPLLVGTLSALLLWLLLALFYLRLTAVNRANEKSYASLLWKHLSALDSYLDSQLPEDTKKATLAMLLRAKIHLGARIRLWGWIRQPAAPAAQPKGGSQPQGSTSTQPSTPAQSGAAAAQPLSHWDGNLQEVLRYRDAIYLALMQRNTSWILGKGYVGLWDLMDSAEEALIIVASPAKVVGDAVYDEMRLNDSKVANSEEWGIKLRSAVTALDPDAVQYLKSALGTQPQALQQANPQPPPPGQGGNAGAQQQDMALAILRKVREMINDFNTNSWNALISARNQLLATMNLVGLTTYVFVELAILFHVKTPQMVVATIFAFIGALAGLIGRLYTESQSDTTIDDYRLSTARLLVTPLLSGLAAVIGVLVVAKVDSLGQIYTFTALVPNLIIAATFGLTPNLLINQLQKKSEGYKANLQSTRATSGK
jgi:hypothetical protein